MPERLWSSYLGFHLPIHDMYLFDSLLLPNQQHRYTYTGLPGSHKYHHLHRGNSGTHQHLKKALTSPAIDYFTFTFIHWRKWWSTLMCPRRQQYVYQHTILFLLTVGVLLSANVTMFILHIFLTLMLVSMLVLNFYHLATICKTRRGFKPLPQAPLWDSVSWINHLPPAQWPIGVEETLFSTTSWSYVCHCE